MQYKKVTRLKKNLVWVHAVSLGEVQGVTPLLEKLHEIDPDRMIFLTVTTKTAWDYMQQYVKTVFYWIHKNLKWRFYL